MSADSPMPCIVCGVVPERALPPTASERGPVQPYAATQFTTQGHYGSTVFDPLCAGEYLCLNVCDECLVGASRHGRVQYVEYGSTQLPPVTVEAWTPEGLAAS